MKLSDQNRWILYDWANSAWITVILTTLFPILYRDVWAEAPSLATTDLALITIAIQICIAVLAPIIGDFADRSGSAPRLLFLFTVGGALFTMLLGSLPKESGTDALFLYGGASVFFFLSVALYDSLLPHICKTEHQHKISLLGYGFGYVGGGLCLLISAFALTKSFNLYPLIFLFVAVWWVLFSLPIRSIKIPTSERPKMLGETFSALKEIFKDRRVFLFLFAYWLYIDGVNTVTRFAADFARSLELPASSIITALVITQFVGLPASLVFVRLSKYFGAYRSILGGLVGYIIAAIFGSLLQTEIQFYVLAIWVGLIQGGVQALSRSIFSTMIPVERSGLAFGVYNTIGRLGCILGPTLFALSNYYTDSSRLGAALLTLLFVGGGFLLYRSQIQRN